MPLKSKDPNLAWVTLGKRGSMTSTFWSEENRRKTLDYMQSGEAEIGGRPLCLALSSRRLYPPARAFDDGPSTLNEDRRHASPPAADTEERRG